MKSVAVVYPVILLLTALIAIVGMVGQIVWSNIVFDNMWGVASLVTLSLSIPITFYGFATLEPDTRASVVLLMIMTGVFLSFTVLYVIRP